MPRSSRGVNCLEGQRLATKENSSVVGFKWSQPAVGWAFWILLRRPCEIARGQAGALQPVLQACGALPRKRWRFPLTAYGQRDRKLLMVAAGCEVDDLPVAGYVRWQVADRESLLDEDAITVAMLYCSMRRRHEVA
jgi:hypothetical protein